MSAVRFRQGAPTIHLRRFQRWASRVELPLAGPTTAGSFSGRTARFERAHDGFDCFTSYQSLGLLGGVAAHNGKQDGSKPLRATNVEPPFLPLQTRHDDL